MAVATAGVYLVLIQKQVLFKMLEMLTGKNPPVLGSWNSGGLSLSLRLVEVRKEQGMVKAQCFL